MRTPTTRPNMIRYLSEHFRYQTMHSWNGSTSYARNVKLSRLKFHDRATENRAWELVAVPEARAEIRALMRQFAEAHDFQWQAGFNGRSAGYLVLYSGGRRPTWNRSVCTRCGQLNFQAVAAGTNASCGVCGELRENLPAPRLETYTLPGLGLDMNQDFDIWKCFDEATRRARLQESKSDQKVFRGC